MAERAEARRQGDFARADALRDAIWQLGAEVRDTPEGPGGSHTERYSARYH